METSPEKRLLNNAEYKQDIHVTPPNRMTGDDTRFINIQSTEPHSLNKLQTPSGVDRESFKCQNMMELFSKQPQDSLFKHFEPELSVLSANNTPMKPILRNDNYLNERTRTEHKGHSRISKNLFMASDIPEPNY